jgi:hypothetical protein
MDRHHGAMQQGDPRIELTDSPSQGRTFGVGVQIVDIHRANAPG